MIFDQIKQELKGWDIESVADAAGHHKSTLYFWLENKTKNPHINTLIDVAEVLGYEVKLVRQRVQLKLVA